MQPDSPAKKAGLLQGDLITAFNGKPIKDPRDMAMAVAETPAGKTVPVTITREGHEKTVDVTIDKLKTQEAAAENKEGEGPIGWLWRRSPPENRDQLGIDATVQGVMVARVAPDSRAAGERR